MRAVARSAGTTTPTVYERYRDRDDILRALRLKTRKELFGVLSRTRTLSDAVQAYLRFALDNTHAYEVLFDAVGKPPSLHEPWPSFNLMRQRLGQQLHSPGLDHNRLMLAIWSLMHGAAMLIIRGEFEGALRTQAIHACVDTVENLVRVLPEKKGWIQSGPKWPSSLVLGEGAHSSAGSDRPAGKKKSRKSGR
jgi:AcrR family transcriptional regulator